MIQIMFSSSKVLCWLALFHLSVPHVEQKKSIGEIRHEVISMERILRLYSGICFLFPPHNAKTFATGSSILLHIAGSGCAI